MNAQKNAQTDLVPAVLEAFILDALWAAPAPDRTG